MSDEDVLTELLIAKLLEEDMCLLHASRQAEVYQVNQALADSSYDSDHTSRKPPEAVSNDDDSDLALRLMVTEAHLNSDAALAQSLQHSEDVSIVASQQYAQKLAATEKKLMLDLEFARRLQEAEDAGESDTDDMQNAEDVLDQNDIDQILAVDPNNKGKRKADEINSHTEKGRSLSPEMRINGKWPKTEQEDFKIKTEPGTDMTPYPTCGICMDSFQATHSPISASRSANSSSRLPFGMHLPCPKSHAYCHSCISSYIHSKLDPEGDGSGNLGTVVFPIRCPECSLTEWADGIPDDAAARVLAEKGMLLWHHQKLLDTLPRYYCPNPRCSTLVQVDDDPDEPQATCPACNIVICVPCRVVWHDDLTCEEYQALPLDERSPEDQQALQLAKAKNWRRCPSCTFIVELTVGCNHITCRCRTEFCFKCGSLWDKKTGSCSRQCELWDEEMLLEERERAREAQRAPRQPAPVPAPAPAFAPPPYVERAPEQIYHHIERDSFDWMSDDDILCKRHWFTTQMIDSLTCEYCDTRLTSLADLQYHLSHTRRHYVYACCGRFFKREVDFERHVESYSHRFNGAHVHQIRRD